MYQSTEVIHILKLIVAALAGALAGASIAPVFNNIPGKWLSDYGEPPVPGRGSGKRRIDAPVLTLVFGAGMSYAAILAMSTHGLAEAMAITAALWLLLFTAIADGKYMIIPDQTVALLAAIALMYAFIKAATEHGSESPGTALSTVIADSLQGMLIASGIYILIGVIGRILGKKETLGFGDIKLLAAAGLLCGSQGAVFIVMGTALFSAVGFSGQMLFSKLSFGDEKALGPYISLSCAVYLLVL